MKSAYDIRIRISGGSNGRPRDGDGVRMLRGACRVAPATHAQLETWLAEMRKINPKVNDGQLLDWIVALVQRRIGTELKENVGGYRLEKISAKQSQKPKSKQPIQ